MLYFFVSGLDFLDTIFTADSVTIILIIRCQFYFLEICGTLFEHAHIAGVTKTAQVHQKFHGHVK